MQAEEFKGYCRAQLTLGFQHILAGKYDEKHKYRTEGLLQAARKARKDSLAQLKDSAPDEYYAIPAIYRKS